MDHIQHLFVFWSEADATISGLTFDPDGNNLPTEFAPWSKNGDGAPIYTETASASTNSIVLAVERDGFYLFQIASDKADKFAGRVQEPHRVSAELRSLA